MALVVNGTTVKKVNYNGTALKKIIVNGVQVWTAEVSVYNADYGSKKEHWSDYGYDKRTVTAASVSVNSSRSYWVSASASTYIIASDSSYGTVICKITDLSVAGGSSGRIVSGISNVTVTFTYERQACVANAECWNIMVVDVTELLEAGLTHSQIASHMGYFTGTKTITL